MRLHLIGLFHTLHKSSYSHCAFTGKALRFSKMMQAVGWDVIEYANEGSESEAKEKVVILTEEEYKNFYGARGKKEFFGNTAVVGSEPHKLFEQRLIQELKERVKPKDIICHPFGHAHEILVSLFPEASHVETGIGYPTLMKGSFHIFESYAWMHYHQGKENRNGKNYEWVVPNYYDLEDWEPYYEHGTYLAFLGRITVEKGMDTIRAIADHSPYPIVLHGQGDPSPWSHPNIIYQGPIHGRKRSSFLRNAKALLAPSYFTEPFCGMTVEAMLCGTPVITVDYGAMTETVTDGVHGFRCHTLQNWIDAINNIDQLDRKVIANNARSKYSLEACGKKYDKIFNSINDLWGAGWYQLREPKEINYQELDEEEKPFAERLAAWVKENIDPPSVIDIGCGPGTYVKAFNKKEIKTIGYDIDPRVKDKPNLFCKSLFDLDETEQADLVLCLEVAEHIEETNNDKIVCVMDTALKPGGILIWTAAKPGQGGVGHINCKSKKYWTDLFSSTKLTRCKKMESELINYCKEGYHMGWFTQNLLIYRKDG